MEATAQSTMDQVISPAPAYPQGTDPAEKKIAVMEIFGPTIQGEGLVAGHQTLFIRFGGCDYRCTKCDSLHAVLPERVQEGATYMTTTEILAQVGSLVAATGVRWITLSGGNPAIQQLGPLVRGLHDLGLGIAVETQGTVWANWLVECDVITVSPKGPGMGEVFRPDQFEVFLSQLAGHPGFSVKVVIMDQRDIEFAAALAAKYTFLTQVPDVFWLSLGNPFPPAPKEGEEGVGGAFMWTKLVAHYQVLLEDLMIDKRLRTARILPQVHVLIYGNKKGV
jgi:7-carboxy-7-deazaguanine synthase